MLKKCKICGANTTRYICNSCFKEYKPEIRYEHVEFLEEVITLFSLKEYTRDLIFGLKYKKMLKNADILADLVTQSLPDNFFDKYDCLTFIPTSYYKIFKRGFNQSKELSKAFAKILNIKVIDTLKEYEMKSIHNIDAKNRRRHIKYYDCTKDVLASHILIIDDIFTTGATLKNAAKAIRIKNPTTKVSALTIAGLGKIDGNYSDL